MKKEELFEIYEEWMKEEEKRLAHYFSGSDYEELHEVLHSSYKEVKASLKYASTPLEFFRRLDFSYNWYVKQLRNAAMEGKPLPYPTDLDQFIDVFVTKAIGGMRWEDENSEVSGND